MANLKDIKSRISSVENTKKITRAMKMVAAAKVKKAEMTVKANRPFSDELIIMFKRLLAKVGVNSAEGLNVDMAIDNYPELLKKRNIDTAGILVITSNKGLAGAYNANVVRKTLEKVRNYNEKNIKVKLFVVGLKGISSLKRKANEFNFEIAKHYTSVASDVTASGANVIAEDLAQAFIEDSIDSIEIVTTKFKNMMSYRIEEWEILPIDTSAVEKVEVETSVIEPLMIFEPSEQEILQKIVPLYLTNTIYQALLEAQASELASRMTAMSAASNNAEEMIKTLTIDYNKARQWAITQEILEVISGADALKG